MNNPKIVFLSKSKPAATVGEVFHEYIELVEFPANLATAIWDGSRAQLIEVTALVTGRRASEMFLETPAPTVSYIVQQRKSWASDWWLILTEVEGGPSEDDANTKRAIEQKIKTVVDAVAHKKLTGYDLPVAKDGFSQNAMQVLRKATGHGDAAIFLYRVRYWWPKATIILGKRKWIAKTHLQWAEELGMEVRTFRTAYDRLVKLDLIEAVKAEFRGASINHIRPTEAGEKLFAQTEKQKTV